MLTFIGVGHPRLLPVESHWFHPGLWSCLFMFLYVFSGIVCVCYADASTELNSVSSQNADVSRNSGRACAELAPGS